MVGRDAYGERPIEAHILKILRASAILALLGMRLLAADAGQVRKIEDRFLAPCCWQESVAVHNSEIAIQMRAEIASRVSKGQSEEQIVEAYVARYGERILREPRGSKRWWLMLVPVAFVLLAAAGLFAFLSRQRHRPAVAQAGGDLPPLPDFELD